MKKYLLAASLLTSIPAVAVDLVEVGVTTLDGRSYSVNYDRDSILTIGKGARVTMVVIGDDKTALIFNAYYDCVKHKAAAGDKGTIVFPNGKSRDIKLDSSWGGVSEGNLVFAAACSE